MTPGQGEPEKRRGARPPAAGTEAGPGSGDRTQPRAGPDAGRGARRRRRLLGRAFLLALATLLTLNAAAAVRERAAASGSPIALGLQDAWRALEGVMPRPREVRVFRPGLPRWAANRLKGQVRVGLQVGHLSAADQPEELAVLRYSTGAHYGGLDEVSVNAAVVEALAARLRARGALVDVLPATVPVRYRADLVLSVHADANEDETRNGYKSAHFWPERNAREPLLKVLIDRAVASGTGLADDDRNVSGNMFGYYAFNDRRFRHAVAPGTPALLVELGYLSSSADRRLLTRPEALAAALEEGVAAYLKAVGRVPEAW